MPLIPSPDDRHCTRCGVCGFTRRSCPQCPCVYCKEDHAVADCKIAPPCGRCGKKGHPERFCRVPPPQVCGQKRVLAQAQAASCKKELRQGSYRKLTVMSPQHDDDDWFAIHQDVRDVCTHSPKSAPFTMSCHRKPRF